ncbi:hypothetical protein T484DRAFT_1908601, partial [Baffinella frigidus]
GATRDGSRDEHPQPRARREASRRGDPPPRRRGADVSVSDEGRGSLEGLARGRGGDLRGADVSDADECRGSLQGLARGRWGGCRCWGASLAATFSRQHRRHSQTQKALSGRRRPSTRGGVARLLLAGLPLPGSPGSLSGSHRSPCSRYRQRLRSRLGHWSHWGDWSHWIVADWSHWLVVAAGFRGLADGGCRAGPVSCSLPWPRRRGPVQPDWPLSGGGLL